MAGGMGKKQRKQVAEQITGLPDDQPRLILATGRYLGEGFDDPKLDTLFLALPTDLLAWHFDPIRGQASPDQRSQTRGDHLRLRGF
jgi:hypothetical protein